MVKAQLCRLTYPQRVDYIREAHDDLGVWDFMAICNIALELPVKKGGLLSEDIMKVWDDSRKPV